MLVYRDVRKFDYILWEVHTVQTKIKPPENVIFKDIILTMDGLLTINKGAMWNGITGGIDTESGMEASLVHDKLYVLLVNGLISPSWRKEIDKLYYNLCLKNGMSKWRAKLHLAALRVFGRFFAKEH